MTFPSPDPTGKGIGTVSTCALLPSKQQPMLFTSVHRSQTLEMASGTQQGVGETHPRDSPREPGFQPGRVHAAESPQ